MSDLISENVMLCSNSTTGTGSMDVDTGIPFGTPRNGSGDTRQLAVVLSVLALAGGASPSVALVVSRKEEDACGNQTGTLTSIYSPAALTGVSSVSTNIGPNQTTAANLSRFARLAVTVAGGPTTCEWVLSSIVTR